MRVLKTLTAGESHGPRLVGIIEGFPAQVPLSVEKINFDLKRRQGGFGRGLRQSIEQDKIEFIGGLRGSVTIGSPLAFLIKNRDYSNWEEYMDPVLEAKPGKELFCPRPGHADLSGAIKYGYKDLRPIIERSSARETAIRVAIGSICAQLLAKFGIVAKSHVLAIGESGLTNCNYTYEDLDKADLSDLRCIDQKVEIQMIETITKAKKDGDSVGGLIEVVIRGVPMGLGSHVQWDRKLDSRLAGALMSIQGIKGVEIGAGFDAASLVGSEFHDSIFHDQRRGFYRSTNNSGGIEGGISTGEDLVLKVAMKPIPTLTKPLPTVDLRTLEAATAAIERSDVCAVPAASVVAELVAMTVLADAFLEVYGADYLGEIKRRWQNSL